MAEEIAEKQKKPKKEKPKGMTVPRQPMPELPVEERLKGFKEVALGYPEQLARIEAERCLQCKVPHCVDGCPVNIDIPRFIRQIAEGDYDGALETMKKDNFMPAICGRVCQQEVQCEAVCVLAKKYEPVAVGRLERFIGDWERQKGTDRVKLPELPPPTGFKVGVIGSGPAGLTAAFDLRMAGHEVTVFEALHKPGGVLRYGIPEFRMPNDIIEENVDFLRALGVEIRCDFVVGLTATVDQLMNEMGYDALFVAVGAGLPKFLHIEGENLCGVFSANEFLTRVNLMVSYKFPDYDTPLIVGKEVAVLGAGNTAMDAARTARRLSPGRVRIIYRRSIKEVPARAEEFEHARQEGVEFLFLTAPVRILGDDRGWVRAIEVQKMKLGEPDESGRRRPIPIEGSNYVIEVDTVINAIGTMANKTLFQTAPDIERDKRGYVVTDPETLATSRPGVFAGGDIVGGGATVIKAMGDGRRAARAINEYLKSRKPRKTIPAQ